MKSKKKETPLAELYLERALLKSKKMVAGSTEKQESSMKSLKKRIARQSTQ